jgi:hypothetical protein
MCSAEVVVTAGGAFGDYGVVSKGDGRVGGGEQELSELPRTREQGDFPRKQRGDSARTGQSPRGIRGLDRFLQKQITVREQGSDHCCGFGDRAVVDVDLVGRSAPTGSSGAAGRPLVSRSKD